MHVNYDVGDKIKFETLTGATRIGVVIEKDVHTDVTVGTSVMGVLKAGPPGFYARLADGSEIFGYDSLVKQVMPART